MFDEMINYEWLGHLFFWIVVGVFGAGVPLYFLIYCCSRVNTGLEDWDVVCDKHLQPLSDYRDGMLTVDVDLSDCMYWPKSLLGEIDVKQLTANAPKPVFEAEVMIVRDEVFIPDMGAFNEYLKKENKVALVFVRTLMPANDYSKYGNIVAYLVGNVEAEKQADVIKEIVDEARSFWEKDPVAWYSAAGFLKGSLGKWN